MRDYLPGDDIRAIDWKATARMNRLISREYQEERDQQVIFVLDCGRRMRARDGAISHFDHALNIEIVWAEVAVDKLVEKLRTQKHITIHYDMIRRANHFFENEVDDMMHSVDNYLDMRLAPDCPIK